MAAMDTLTGAVQFTFQLQVGRTYPGVPSSGVQANWTKQMRFALGAAVALGANEVYGAVRTLAGGANEELDLAGSGLTNLVGDTGITFARVKAVLIWLLSATDSLVQGDGSASVTGTLASSIKVGGAATNAFKLFMDDVTDKIVIPNGGMAMFSDPGATGLVVTAGTADKLKVENMDGAVSAKYLIVLLGSAT